MLYVSGPGMSDLRSKAKKFGSVLVSEAKQRGRQELTAAGNRAASSIGDRLLAILGGGASPAPAVQPRRSSALPWLLGGAALVGGAVLLGRRA